MVILWDKKGKNDFTKLDLSSQFDLTCDLLIHPREEHQMAGQEWDLLFDTNKSDVYRGPPKMCFFSN